MNQHQPPRTETLDELLHLLSDRQCRSTLRYFRDVPEETISVRGLAHELGKRDDEEPERIAQRLHHSTLPRLAEVGVVDYDARSRTVRYQGRQTLDDLLDALPER